MRAFDERDGLVELRARGEKIFAICEGSAVILDVGEFDSRSAGGFGEGQHFLELIDVAAMDDKVERDGDTVALEPLKDAQLLLVGFGAGDFVSGIFAGALEAELEMVEAGIRQEVQLDFVEWKAGADEIDVKSRGTGGTNEFDDVRAGERFAAGEVCLEDAEFGGFAEDAGPCLGSELVSARLHFERIRTVDAVERASVRQFGDESERIGDCCRHDSVPLE